MIVRESQDLVCTITNTRKTGTIIVKKALNPASDAGKFDLQVDGADHGMVADHAALQNDDSCAEEDVPADEDSVPWRRDR